CGGRGRFQAIRAGVACAAWLILPLVDLRERRNAECTATLASQFQISLPKPVRTARHWEAGQVFAFLPKGEGVPAATDASSDGREFRLIRKARGRCPSSKRGGAACVSPAAAVAQVPAPAGDCDARS